MKEYLHEWGVPETDAAEMIAFSNIAKEDQESILEWIWEPERKAGVYFGEPVRRRV